MFIPSEHNTLFPPEPAISIKELKNKMNSGPTKSYMLPKLEEIVLLKPVDIPKWDPSTVERCRDWSIVEQLARYNRWLTFAEPSKGGKDVRSAAANIQHAVNDINSMISTFMLQVDRKIVALQDSTDAFANAVQAGELWQSSGKVLDMSSNELNTWLLQHPDRDTPHHLQMLRAVIHDEARENCTRYSYLYDRPTRLADNLLRVAEELRSCPNGTYEAFHAYIFILAYVFDRQGSSELDTVGFPEDRKVAESRISSVVRDADQLTGEGRKRPRTIFFNFALAKRTIWNALPTDCTTCRTEMNFPNHFFDTEPQCRRGASLRLIERLQLQAYREIRSGIMLTLTSKLPKELCLLVFEFTMAVEGIAENPRVFEPGVSPEVVMFSSCRRRTPKREYRCHESLQRKAAAPGAVTPNAASSD